MFKKIFIAGAMILLLTASAGVAKMAGLLPGSASSGVFGNVAAAHMADEVKYERAETIKQKEAEAIAESEAADAAKAAEKKEPTPREIFASLFPEESYDDTLIVLAKVLRGEASGVKSDTNKACVIWCVLNRVDTKMRGDTVIDCALSDAQFNYHRGTPVVESFKKIAEDVLKRWLLEKTGAEEVGRVLPENYCFFYGNGRYNVFRDQYMIHGSNRLTPVHSEVYGD